MDDMGIPHHMMPRRIVQSSDIVGGLTAGSAEELGLPEGTPVCAGGVDCGVATLGLGVFDGGDFAAAIGTSMCAALVHEQPIEADGLIAWPYVTDSRRLTYSFGGGATAGAVVKWFRDTFAQLEKREEQASGVNAYRALDEAAERISCGSDGLVARPYLMGERSPLWDTDARGVIFGLSLAHTRAHVYRAFLEAVAYSLRHTIEAFNTDLGDTVLLAGGVTKSRLWRRIFADVTGCSVVCPRNDVEATLGDVMLAGLGTGVLSKEQIKGWCVLDEKVAPNPENHARYNGYYRIYRSIYEHLKGDMANLSGI